MLQMRVSMDYFTAIFATDAFYSYLQQPNFSELHNKNPHLQHADKRQ